jgi:hypothetical protein
MAETRKLAAILAADVLGYSKLAGSDEDRTLARLRALRSDLIDPTIAVHNGRMVKRTGDGSLVEFRSVVDAVRCAIEVQNGMVTPSAEFNIWADPHAADIVFRCGRPIVALSLDVTHQVLVTRSVLARVQAIGNPVSLASYDMLSFFNRYDSNKYGSDGAPQHDACTMAYLLKPELFRTKTCSVVVEIHSPLTRGHTAVDFWHVTKNDKYVDWAYAVDTAGFFDLMIDRLGRYSV